MQQLTMSKMSPFLNSHVPVCIESIVDRRNEQLKFENFDVNKPFKTDTKVMGSNLVIN